MAWTAPSTFVAGAILTAASLNTNVRDNSLAGGPIYTTEALRDAAITSPFEGQRAYLTAPTVPAGVGTTVSLPTGILTIYNGSVWVCVTPPAAYIPSSQSTTSTSYTDLASPGPAVTVSTGTTALVTVNGILQAGATGSRAFMGFAVSGATTKAASDLEGSLFLQSASGATQVCAARTFVVSGLTAGTNTFTAKYRVDSSTGTFEARQIIVQGIA
jgi:hypothetical protein